jgi:octaprenyl-diphosphate synthase
MNLSIQQIIAPITDYIDCYKETYQLALKSNNALVQQMVEHVNTSSGKQMRPILVMLCAQACGQVSSATIHGAISLELLHVATLIHDDVIDESDQRRGKPSLMAKFKSKTSVLGGDFFLSSALSESVKTQHIGIVGVVANMGQILVDGELLQLTASKEAIYNENYYFNVIKAKTASLFSACTKIGVLSAGKESDKKAQCLIEMGEYIGTCFKIKDDIFDYQQNNDLGKPVGNDIQEGKMTLPLLYVYEHATSAEKEDILQAFNNKDIDYIQQLVVEKGGIAYTQQKITYYKEKALQCLQDFEDTPTRRSIEQYITLVADRKK